MPLKFPSPGNSLGRFTHDFQSFKKVSNRTDGDPTCVDNK